MPEPLAPGTLIITEVMPNPDSVKDDEGEWFEIFNPTMEAISLIGWTFKDEKYSFDDKGNPVVTGDDEHLVNRIGRMSALLPRATQPVENTRRRH